MFGNQQTPDYETGQTSFNVGENIPEIHFDVGEGTPMQLVRIVNNREFQVVPETLAHIKEIDGGIAICSVVGKYRTGKSFLMNRLLELHGNNSFVVSASVNACTKGIWIWSRPVYIQKDNLNIFFMDTEGLDSIDRDSDVDSRLFALLVLISSYFIYNSTGAIDEGSINALAMITHLIRTVTVEDNRAVRNEYQLSQYAPKLLWVLRDFVLEIKDTRGKSVSAQQYLESALADIPVGQGGYTRDAQKSTQVRQAILNFFKYRDCITMVRPVNDEGDLRKLQELPDGRIRFEFLHQLHAMRDKIFKNCTQKMIDGVGLNTQMFGVYLRQFVDNFNSGKMPSIQTTWRALIESECASHYDQAVEFYATDSANMLQDRGGTMKSLELFKGLNELRDLVSNYYNKIAYIRDRNPQVFDKYKSKLQAHIQDAEKKLIAKNNAACSSANADLINGLVADYVRRQVPGERTDDQITADIHDNLIGAYVQNTRGGLEAQDFARNSQSVISALLSWFSNSQTQANNRRRNEASRKLGAELERYNVELEQVRLKEDRANALRRDIEAVERRANELKRGVDSDRLSQLTQNSMRLDSELTRLQKESDGFTLELRSLGEQIDKLTKKKR